MSYEHFWADAYKGTINWEQVLRPLKEGRWKVPSIKKVIYHAPATIVYWKDGSKTVVRANNEPFDAEKGLAMAISKKSLGNEGNYFEVFKSWRPTAYELDDLQLTKQETQALRNAGIGSVAQLTECTAHNLHLERGVSSHVIKSTIRALENFGLKLQEGATTRAFENEAKKEK